MLGPDTIVSAVLAILVAATAKPTGLATTDIFDHDLLPTEEADLPVVGVYLVDDQQAGYGEAMGGEHTRQARIRVEIRASGAPLAGTKAIREWALKAVLNDTTLNNQTAFNIDYQGFQPFSAATNMRLCGADLDFLATYLFIED